MSVQNQAGGDVVMQQSQQKVQDGANHQELMTFEEWVEKVQTMTDGEQ